MRFAASGILCLTVAAACGTGGDETSSNDIDGGTSDGATPSCEVGVPTGDECCDPIQACGDECCPSAQVCFFGACTTPGKDCTDSSDCSDDEYCDFSLHPNAPLDAPLGCSAGATTGSCFPRPKLCAPGEDPSAGTCVTKCELAPEKNFELVEKYTLPGSTLMTPIVVQLDDDNCDGVVNGLDVPEIVYAPGYDEPSPVIAVSIVDGQVVEKWKNDVVLGASQLAAADLDGDGRPEVVGVSSDGLGLVALSGADGSTKWQTPIPDFAASYEAPAIARAASGGPALVLANFTLLDGASGALVKQLAESEPRAGGEKNCGTDAWFNFARFHSYAGFADLDGDGTLDVTDGARAYRIDGTKLWDLRIPSEVADERDRKSGYHAVADLDRDGVPEVVYTSYGRRKLNVVHWDAASGTAAEVRDDLSIDLGLEAFTEACERKCTGGGPPVIADFDGDGFPDVGVAGAIGYIVFSGPALMAGASSGQARLWSVPTVDCSSAFTSSSVFDFDGDGSAEVVYADEQQLFILDGATGERKNAETPSASSTVGEMPVVADVDGDDHADLLVPNSTGVHVFGSKSGAWVRTRRIWNQHTYHVTNINDDGTLPDPESPNWTTPGLDNFRQNVQPGEELLAPDATITVAARCYPSHRLSALVRNLGEVPLPAKVSVEFFAGTPETPIPLGAAFTAHPLSPGESETVELAPWGGVPEATTIFGIVNAQPLASGPLLECRTDNNQSQVVPSACTDRVK